MLRLRAHPIIAARDFYYSYVIYEEELKEAAGSTYFSRLWDCFAVPRIRRANYGASTVMLAQQMCGINSKSLSHPSMLLPAYCFADSTQSSHSTAQPFLRGSAILQHRRCMLPWGTVPFKSSSQSLHCF